MDSKRVLEIFKEITRVPRESGHEELIISYLQSFASSHGLECRTDKAGNVLIVKKAAEGKENVPVIVLQSHSDMVCEKNSGVEHDFSRDPIKYVIEDGWMVARDTTLGADCGIGMAATLAALEDPAPTGRIEGLFTVSEETGLDGAKALEPDFITGKILINLDSEDEGELFVGCAGGMDTTAYFRCGTKKLSKETKLLKLRIFNGLGGHSGDDIDKGRCNAVQQLARFLYYELKTGFDLCSINGGNKRNAIAREAEAVISVSDAEAVSSRFLSFADDLKREFSVSDPCVQAEASVLEETVPEVFDRDCAYRLVSALFAAPHGVLAMSMDIAGLVETSTNLASVRTEASGLVRVGTSQRSSVTSERHAAAAKVEACLSLAGAQVSHESEYPGWKPDLSSGLLKVCRESYRKLFSAEPVVRAIHAGLECGLFLDKYPGLDMISFGPTLKGVHAPGERLDLKSLDKFVVFLDDVLASYAGNA